MIQRIRSAWSDLLTKLNAAATFTLTYLALNGQLPPAFETELLKLSQPWQILARVMVPIAWGTLIEFAKARAIKKAV